MEDTESAGAEISDYQVAVTENAVYFIDPRVGLLSLDPESKAVTTILAKWGVQPDPVRGPGVLPQSGNPEPWTGRGQ